MTARALTHREVVDGVVASLRGVAHGALRVVHRPGQCADEWYRYVVGHLIHRRLAPLHLFEPVHTLVVYHVGVCARQAGGLVCAVEVDQQAVSCCRARNIVAEAHHAAVVAVHEVDLESLDAHLREVAAYPLDVAVERPVTRPEYDAHAALRGVVDEHSEIYFWHYLPEIGSTLDAPTLVEDYILDARPCCEVYIIFICIVVDSRAEVDAVDAPCVPPVPSHLARFDPRYIVQTTLRGQTPHDVAVGQLTILVGYGHHAPREGARTLHLDQPRLAAYHLALQHVVAALPHLVRFGGEDSLQ